MRLFTKSALSSVLLSTLSLRMSINPSRIPEFSRERILKHLIQRRIRLILLLVHDNANITCQSRSLIPPRPVVLVLRHGGIEVHPWIRSTPFDVPVGLNRIIKITVCEDGTMLSVPRAAQCALAGYGEGRIGFLDVGVVDVDAVFVDKGCVAALPCCDAAAAVTKRDKTGLDPRRAETIEKVCLSGYFVLIEVRVA